MKNRLIILLLLFGLAGSLQTLAQAYLERQFKGTNPNELVSLSSTLSFDQAVELLNKVSESATGKRVVSTVSLADPIGLQIDNMDYYKALVVLVQYKDLMFEEKEDLIVIKRKTDPSSVERNSENYAPVEEREVKISAVFFEMNVNESKEKGIDWKVLLSGNGINIGGMHGIDREKQESGSGSEEQEQPRSFDISADGTFDLGGFFGEATAVFKFFENENLGEIIASPNLTVRNGKPARLQAGADISIKQRDFAQNVIEQFYSTGTIMNVTPFVYNESGIDYLLLNIDVERSSYVPDQNTTVINKTKANTQVLMLNGEETIIGGLFVNDETLIRNGVPFLKDLPWWVFGLRYIFGSDQIIASKKELVILIKAELVPTLKERLAGPQSPTLIRDEVERQRERIKIHQLNQLPTNEN
ncbi:MAG: type II and III secretion system protein [Ignavibacteriaceae bacterium]